MRLLATNRALTLTYLRFAMTTLCMYTVLYGLTQWLEASRGVSAREAGLLLLPMTGLAVVVVLPTFRHNVVRLPLITAAISCLAASVGVVFLITSTPIVSMVIVTLVFGITFGTTSIGTKRPTILRSPQIRSAPPPACFGPLVISGLSPPPR